jgi:hypothetical protein
MTTTAVRSQTSDLTRNNKLRLVLFGVGLVTALLTVFVGWRAQSFVAPSADPYGYVAMGRSLLHGEGFAPYGSVLNRRGPLYPALIAFVYLVIGERPVALQLLQCLMFAGVCALAYDTGRRLYNVRTGILGALICAVHPALLRYVPDFHIETFLTLLSMATIWRGVIFVQHPGPKNGVLVGLFAALGALAKPVLLLFPLVFGLYWLLQQYLRTRGQVSAPSRETGGEQSDSRAPAAPMRVAIAAVAAIFVTMGALILPWTYRNYRSSGHVVLITTGFGDAFLRGYIFSKPEYALLRLPPYTYAENESNAFFNDLCAKEGTVWQRNDVESEKILSKYAKEKLRAEPAEFVRKFFTQLFTFWYQMTSLTNSLITGLAALVLWVFALVGWRRARAEERPSWPLLMPILCLNLALAVLLALGRYSVPVLPALAVLAAFGIDSLLLRRSGPPGASAGPRFQ